MRSFVARLLGDHAGATAITWTLLVTLVTVATIVRLSGIDPLQPIDQHPPQKISR